MPMAAGGAEEMERWPRTLISVIAAVGILWLLACWPLLSGSRTLYFRDLFGLFVPLKAFGAEQLAQGTVPALNPTWALGQPFRGNPNSSAFYPTNLFYLALPFWIAFNLHLCLHWLLGTVAMWVFVRSTGRSREAAAIAALAYGGGGWMLSALSFYNVVAIAAWWPLVLWGAHRGGRRGIAIGGLCCGLALLAGEPITAALGTLPLALVAIERWGWRRGLLTTAAIGLLGVLVALPQLVATARVLPTTFRGTHGVLASQAGYYRLHPARFLELVVPLPFGAPDQPIVEAERRWSTEVMPHVPFYYSLYPGAVAGLLALVGCRRRPWLAALAAGAALVAWSPGLSGQLVADLSIGLVRSPEKVTFWLAFALPLLAAAGFDRLREEGSRRPALRWAYGVGATLLAGALVLVAMNGFVEPLELGQLGGLGRALVVSLLIIALAAWAVWRGLGGALVGLQLLALVPLMPLLMTDDLAPYRQRSPWIEELDGRRDVLRVESTYPPWRLAVDPPAGERLAARARRAAFELDPVPGLFAGLRYPLAPDLDGMHHRFFDYVLFRTSQAGWDERLAWLRTLGVEAMVSPEPVASPLVRPLASRTSGGSTSFLLALEGAAPAAWWPATLEVAATPTDAYRLVASRGETTAAAVVPAVVPTLIAHHPGATVRVVADGPDRIELEVRGGGGLVVVRRAFQSLWRARSGSLALDVVPADLALTGIVVPAGEHRVELYVSSAPEIAAAVVALLVAAALAVLAVPARRGRGASAPRVRAPRSPRGGGD